MKYTFSFVTDKEKNYIIEQNMDKRLIEIKYLTEGNFLVFIDEKPIELRISELENAQKQQDQAMLETSLQLAMLETNNYNLGGSKNDL